MKNLIIIFLLLFSAVLYAQTNQRDSMNLKNAKKQNINPANKNPDIHITKGISTTVTNQPSSMPNSNTNPTTGTVISLKRNNNAPKANKPSPNDAADTKRVANKTNATLDSSRNKSNTQKRAVKNKAAAKSGY